MKARVPVAFQHQAASAGFALFVAATTLQAQGADSIRVRTRVSLHGDRGRMDVRDLTGALGRNAQQAGESHVHVMAGRPPSAHV